jgi:hypothetical protein
MNPRRRRFVALLAGACLIGWVALWPPRSYVSAQGLPKRISDRDFWQMVVDFSEPGGSFRSDNLVSNERTLQFVIPALKKDTTPGGVYIGVGPEQNFTYISALEPRMAFIIDIRRDNLLLHLMYKALIEMSDDRADFLSRLFSRARPLHLDRKAAPETLFEAFEDVDSSEALFETNLRAIEDHLVKHHGFALSDEDLEGVASVYRAFHLGGPDLRYSFPRQQGVRFPTYAELMLTNDGLGHNSSYLATDERYRALREIEKNNLLVPLVGDFGGDKAIRRVGEYVREHGATVAMFYTSNVEQYLFQTDAWTRFYNNVATLPTDARSTLIRSFFNLGLRSPQNFILTPQSEMLLDPIPSLLDAFHAGQVRSYHDVIQRSR